MRLLLGDAGLRQVLDQDFGLDLELASELVYADLACIRHRLSLLPLVRHLRCFRILSFGGLSAGFVFLIRGIR